MFLITFCLFLPLFFNLVVVFVSFYTYLSFVLYPFSGAHEMASCAPRTSVFEKILKFLFIILRLIVYHFCCFCGHFLSFSVCFYQFFFSFYLFLSFFCSFMCSFSGPHGMDSWTPRLGFWNNIKKNTIFLLLFVFYC